jgi:hypothetical protein
MGRFSSAARKRHLGNKRFAKLNAFSNSLASGVSQRLFAVQSSLGLEYGIRSLATNPVYVAIKLIDDTRRCQAVEPLA